MTEYQARARVISAMCPARVCNVCGEPSRRILAQLNEERGRLGAELRRGRLALGMSQKDVAAWFPSASGGLTGCVWNWENGASVPTVEQWAILRERLNLSDQFDDLIQAERRWNDAEYRDVSDYPSGWTQAADGRVYQRLASRKDRIAPEVFTDCGHDDWRPGVWLDPFADAEN